jgi:peptide/nickel transport system substrate-binding protein
LATLSLAVALAVSSLALTRTTNAQGENFIIDGTFGQGYATLNPIYCEDAECAGVIANIMPNIFATDIKDLQTKAGIPGALAKSVKRSDDGLTFTITLRQDFKWSDGVPVTTKDIVYGWNTVTDAKAESPNSVVSEDVESVKAIDDYTLEVKLKRPQCDSAYNTIGGITGTGGIPPAHILEKTAVDKLKDAEYNTNPTVGSGQYNFVEYRTAELTRLASNQSYPDKQGAKIEHDGIIIQIVPNQQVLVERFLAGEVNTVEEPPAALRDKITAAEKDGKVKTFRRPGTLWDYVLLNLGDPKNPQPAYELDKDGNPMKDKPIKQAPHPIFGDVNVRKAFQLGIDVPSIVKSALYGYGKQNASLLSSANAYNDPDLKPIPYDKAAAEKLLDAAGWAEKGPDGVRIAKGSKFAPDGTRLAFKLYTNQGNKRRADTAEAIKDQLRQIGFDVDHQTIDFNVMIKEQGAQTFDAVIAARGSVYDNSVDWSFLFDPAQDIPGKNGNDSSYINPDLTKMMKDVVAIPGCDQAKAKAMWKTILKTLQDDNPYIWLYTQEYMYAYQGITGVNPTDLSLGYTDTWKLATK